MAQSFDPQRFPLLGIETEKRQALKIKALYQLSHLGYLKGEGGMPGDEHIEILDSNGNPCQYTEFGKKTFGKNVVFGKQTDIRRGTNRVWTFPLGKFFRLAPGDWTLKYRIHLRFVDEKEKQEERTTIESKRISFTILN